MKRRTILLLLVSASAMMLSASGEAISLSLEDSINSALETSADVRIAELERLNAERQNNIGTLFMPDIALTGGIEGSYSFSSPSSSQEPSLTGQVGVSMSLSSSIFSEMELMDTSKEIAELNKESSVEDVKLAVEKSYYSLLSTNEKVEVAKASLDQARRMYEDTLERYENGLSSELDLKNAEYTLKEVEKTYNATILNLESSKRLFSVLIGSDISDYELPDLEEYEIATFLTADEIVSSTRSTSTYLKSLELDRTLAEDSLSVTKAQAYYPTVNASVNLGLGGSTNFGSSSKYNDTSSFSIGVSIPISAYIPYSSSNNSVKNAEAELEKAGIRYEDGIVEYRSQVSSLLESLELDSSNIMLQREKVELKRKAKELAKESYDAGLMTSYEYSSYELDLLTEEITLLEYENSARETEAELSYLIGSPIRNYTR